MKGTVDMFNANTSFETSAFSGKLVTKRLVGKRRTNNQQVANSIFSSIIGNMSVFGYFTDV